MFNIPLRIVSGLALLALLLPAPAPAQTGDDLSVVQGKVSKTPVEAPKTQVSVEIADEPATAPAPEAALPDPALPDPTVPDAATDTATTDTAAPDPAVPEDSLSQVEDWIRENLEPGQSDGQNTGQDAGQDSGQDSGGGQCTAEQAEACVLLAKALSTPHTAFSLGTAALSFEDWAVYGAGRATLPSGSLNPQRDKALGQRSAAVQARKAVLDLLLALPLDGSRTVGQALEGQAGILAEIRGLVQNSRLENSCRDAQPGLEDGVCTALAGMPLLGALAEQLIPMAEPFFSKLPPTVELDPALVANLVRNDQADEAYRQSLAELGGYTGVVIDARGLDAAPALLPRVVDLNGQGAYGSFQVARDAAVKQGMAVYAASADDPRVAERVGATPLTVRALAVTGTNGCDLLVRPADGDLIRKVFQSRELSEAGSLAILR